MQTIYLVANGDLRPMTNRTRWPAQAAMEAQVCAALEREGVQVLRGHAYDENKGHGFIDSQQAGLAVLAAIPATAPLIVAEAVWQYSHHLLGGLLRHQGPILTVANWSGTWPGLVGLLNLNASLTKAGVRYSTLWSEDFCDSFFLNGLRAWLSTGSVTHETPHVHPIAGMALDEAARRAGVDFGQRFRRSDDILGIFDEGCMGMYNAIVPDELLFPLGVYKERLSQSTLYARMLTVPDAEARAIYDWLLARGMCFRLGSDEANELTERQVLAQCKMYIAALRIAAEFGCASIGIQYQQGLKDLTPASDLIEGLLNNVERPPVHDPISGYELYGGEALPTFNEVDECAGLDGLITYRLWRELGWPPENTLHDMRWGRTCRVDGKDQFLWVLEASGAVPPAHLTGGYRGASSERQPTATFPRGGGTIKGIGQPGHVVWSRIFIEDGRLKCDLGLAEAVQLPHDEVERTWAATTRQWPVTHLALRGISRDHMMARHKANHMQVVYAPELAAARFGLAAKASAMQELGIETAICGDF